MSYRQIASGKCLNTNSRQFRTLPGFNPYSRKRNLKSDYMIASKRMDQSTAVHELSFKQKYKPSKPAYPFLSEDPLSKLNCLQLSGHTMPDRTKTFQLGSKDSRNLINLVPNGHKDCITTVKSDRLNCSDFKYEKNCRHLKQTSSTDSREETPMVLSSGLNSHTCLNFKPLKKTSFELHIQKRIEQRRKNLLLLRNFRIIEKIGQGKSGKVFKVMDRVTGTIMAMKVISKEKVLKTNMLEQLIRQLKIQSVLNHPNIAKLYGFFHDKQNLYILTELGCEGQLYSMIKDGRRIGQESASYISNSVLKALEYMHSRKILHRDVKPENIVLVYGCVKLCDFGWAVSNDNELRSTICGTPLYLSPELISERQYDQKVDIWALGVLSFELVTGTTPFNITCRNQLFKIVTSEVEFPKKMQLSDDFKSFIREILRKDPKRRLSCKEIRKLGFIKKYQDVDICDSLLR